MESYWPEFFDESHFCKVNVSLKYMDYARGQAETLLPDKPLGA